MRILAVGIATVDVVNEVPCYPQEDQELRAVRQRIVRGGNAANLVVVLSQLGHVGDWAGVLADDRDASYILEEFERYSVGLDHAVVHPGGKTPVSYIVLSQESGSRTIVHFRDLPEYGAKHFATVDLQVYDWIHFEGRNVPELSRMLKRVAGVRRLTCSLEVEKTRPGIEALFGFPDLLFFGRPYVEATGFTDAETFLSAIEVRRDQLAICAWGDSGAWAKAQDGHLLHSPACKPEHLIDTLGAGDVFNAAVIDARSRLQDPAQALASGCRLAGRKCGVPGLNGLGALMGRD